MRKFELFETHLKCQLRRYMIMMSSVLWWLHTKTTALSCVAGSIVTLAAQHMTEHRPRSCGAQSGWSGAGAGTWSASRTSRPSTLIVTKGHTQL